MKLASYLPGGVSPQFFGDEKIAHVGQFIAATDGSLSYQPDVAGQGLYIFGYSSVWWIDWLGVLAFVGTALGVMTHAGLRYYAAAKNPRPAHPPKRLHVTTIYERLWHAASGYTSSC
jgi:hypothetical protein